MVSRDDSRAYEKTGPRMCVRGMDLPPCAPGQGGWGSIVQKPAAQSQAPTTTGEQPYPNKEQGEHRAASGNSVTPSALWRLGDGYYRRAVRQRGHRDSRGTPK